MTYRTAIYIEADTSQFWCEACVNQREQSNVDADGYPVDELFWTIGYLTNGDSINCTQCESVVVDELLS